MSQNKLDQYSKSKLTEPFINVHADIFFNIEFPTKYVQKKYPPHFIIKINPINFSYLFICSQNRLQYIKYF